MCLLAFLRRNGTVFPRRRLQFSVQGGFGSGFPRRTSSAGNPRGLGGQFLRRRLHFSVPGGFGGPFRRRMVPRSVPGGLGGGFPRRMLPLRYSRRRWRRFPALVTKKADPKGQLCSLLFKICVITQFTCYS